MFVAPVERVPAPHVESDERLALSASLDYQRATLLKKLEGLDDEQLRRPMVPTGLTLLGIVKHLGSVEHAWFQVRFARSAESYLYSTPDDPDADFRIEENETTREIVDHYLEACEQSRSIVERASSLDQLFDDPRRGDCDLRWLLLHMIEETARHNGHADILRELIDGVTGD
jgi:uncharacterized damage-inducible protein DinB